MFIDVSFRRMTHVDNLLQVNATGLNWRRCPDRPAAEVSQTSETT
jgi:hypothetical protein